MQTLCETPNHPPRRKIFYEKVQWRRNTLNAGFPEMADRPVAPERLMAVAAKPSDAHFK
jgi:hypothetical protein